MRQAHLRPSRGESLRQRVTFPVPALPLPAVFSCSKVALLCLRSWSARAKLSLNLPFICFCDRDARCQDQSAASLEILSCSASISSMLLFELINVCGMVALQVCEGGAMVCTLNLSSTLLLCSRTQQLSLQPPMLLTLRDAPASPSQDGTELSRWLCGPGLFLLCAFSSLAQPLCARFS